MAVVLRSPQTHVAARVGLEKAIREIAFSVWSSWKSYMRSDFTAAVNKRADKEIDGDASVKELPRDVQASLGRMNRELVSRVSDGKISRAVDAAGAEVQRSNRANFDRQIEKAIGKKFRAKPRIGDALRSYRGETIRRIKSVRDTVIPTLSKDVAHAYANGWTDEQLADHWIEQGLPVEFGTVEGRARVLATDQLNKLNGEVTRKVHASLGLKTYKWRKSIGKKRPRPHHAARHGKIFAWAKPPSGGHPGTEVMCGCGADAVLDDDAIETMQDVDAGLDTPESPSAPRPIRHPLLVASGSSRAPRLPPALADQILAEQRAQAAERARSFARRSATFKTAHSPVELGRSAALSESRRRAVMEMLAQSMRLR